MKIDTDLRAAIRSAYQARRLAAADHGAQREAERNAIADLFKRCPEVKRSIISAKAKIERLKSHIANEEARIAATGIGDAFYSNGGKEYRITDQKIFRKSGGRFDFKEAKKWGFDAIMAEVAAADEKTARQILRSIGIKWE